jgi:hypothetical protein
VIASRMTSCDVYRVASLFYSAVFELLTFTYHVMNNGL